MNITRRGFIGAILAAGVAPAIVRVGSLMIIKARKIEVATLEDLFQYGSIVSYDIEGNPIQSVGWKFLYEKHNLQIIKKHYGFEEGRT